MCTRLCSVLPNAGHCQNFPLHCTIIPIQCTLNWASLTNSADSSATADLSTISAAVLSCQMLSSNNYAHIDWSWDAPTHDQLEYACLIAYASYCLWSILSQNACVGIPGQGGFTGQLVSLMSGRKIAAYGTLLNHSKTISIPVGGSVKELKVTKTHAVVSVSRVFIEGMIIKAQKHTLQQLGPTPFTILVPLKSLY